MSTTAQWVFERAMALMDELNESTGSADTADTKEYKNRTLSILNILQAECLPCSDTYVVTEQGKRPVCPELGAFNDPLGVDDGLARGALPYGLAAHLLVDENPAAASFFQQRYEGLLIVMKSQVPGVVESIEDLYGCVAHEQFGGW